MIPRERAILLPTVPFLVTVAPQGRGYRSANSGLWQAEPSGPCFRGLQEHLKVCFSWEKVDILRSLPASTLTRPKKSLLDAHRKLSDYYFKFDESPYYTWAALLNPQIGYECMKKDYTDDPELIEYVEDAKKSLHEYYLARYAKRRTASTSSIPIPSTSRPLNGSPQKVNLRVDVDQLLEFLGGLRLL
ncbi:hypothetical protein HGRIS_001212 [Hohenbuehelia grisea]|uniref:Uncharacterized protein n=1 Tax=Hohenbuehelia grisea TaxID=104357 RepID=A0ABR3JPN3_9AGAR